MIRITALSVLTLILLTACGGGDDASRQAAAKPKLSPEGLTENQLKNGIGPIDNIVLGDLDQSLADKGKEVFGIKCVACHKVNERLVGPALAGVTDRRAPAYIMNMILNPDEMVKKHPEVKALLAQYYVPMTFQDVTQEDARAILEYLRTLQPIDTTQAP